MPSGESERKDPRSAFAWTDYFHLSSFLLILTSHSYSACKLHSPYLVKLKQWAKHTFLRKKIQFTAYNFLFFFHFAALRQQNCYETTLWVSLDYKSWIVRKTHLWSGKKAESDFLNTCPVVGEGSMTPSKKANLAAHTRVILQDTVSPISDLTLCVHHSSPCYRLT